MDAREIIIDTLQKTLAGELKSESKVSASHIADAIGEKVNFNRSSMENKNIDLVEKLNTLRSEMTKSLENIEDDADKLLANFIYGKITAYDEIINLL